eukprot:Filipodium_phascolosomae@DN1805_c0_g1_i2.p1
MATIRSSLLKEERTSTALPTEVEGESGVLATRLDEEEDEDDDDDDDDGVAGVVSMLFTLALALLKRFSSDLLILSRLLLNTVLLPCVCFACSFVCLYILSNSCPCTLR